MPTSGRYARRRALTIRVELDPGGPSLPGRPLTPLDQPKSTIALRARLSSRIKQLPGEGNS
jgi:hypothetical protein